MILTLWLTSGKKNCKLIYKSMTNNNFLLKIKKHSVCFYENHNLSNHVSFKTSGVANYYCEPKNVYALGQIIKLCNENDLRFFVLGNGTNTLFYKFEGLIICTKQLKEITVLATGEIIAQAGVDMMRLNLFACQCSLSGLEWSYGIPGSVGGAIRMNAGAYGHEISEFIEKVEIFDGKRFKTLKKDKLWFKYRTSYFVENPHMIVTKVYLKLTKQENNEKIKEDMFEIFEKRKANHPFEPSAGSVFKRQKDIIPAQIIDQLGIKGKQIGGAEISTKHCGFIINKENASVKDVERLIKYVKGKVLKERGIKLETEVIVVKE